VYATSGVNPSELSRPRLWSDDAWAIVRPRRAFRYIEAHPPDSGTWIALRRPLFLALVLGCGFTLLAAGVLTLRIAASATLYWSFVPLTEVLSLLIVTHRLRRGSASQTIDTFFIGHGPSTLLLLALVGTLSILPGERWWNVLTRPAGALGAFVLVAIWASGHLMVNGDPASMVLFGTMLVLALFGTASIDAKRRRALGPKWDAFAAQTSNAPFAAIASGRQKLSLGEVGWWRILLAIAVWALLAWAHPFLFGVRALP